MAAHTPPDPVSNREAAETDDPAFRLRYWGARGSIPTPGRGTTRYGGNTACLELRAGNELIILDAGSGIRELGQALLAEFGKTPIHGHLLISHTHWDHIQGLPFFTPAYVPQNHFKVYGASGMDANFKNVLRGQMDHNYFPVSLDQLGSHLEFCEIAGPSLSIGDTEIVTTFTNHPGLCLAFRFTRKGRSLVYFTDNEPYKKVRAASGDVDVLEFAEEQDREALRFAQGADYFIYDAQYTEEEYKTRVGWGHSTVDDAVMLALGAGVKTLALFHHDPMHDDDFVDGMVRHARDLVRTHRSRLKVVGAREGERFSI